MAARARLRPRCQSSVEDCHVEAGKPASPAWPAMQSPQSPTCALCASLSSPLSRAGMTLSMALPPPDLNRTLNTPPAAVRTPASSSHSAPCAADAMNARASCVSTW